MVIDVAVALEQLHLCDPWKKLSYRIGIAAATWRGDAEHTDVQPALLGPSPVNRQDIGLAARTAESGEPRAIQVLDHPERAGLEICALGSRQLVDEGAEAFLGNAAGRATGGVLHRAVCTGILIDPESLKRAAVQVRLVVRGLQ